MKKLFIFVTITLFLIEFILYTIGFKQSPLYKASNEYEYIYKENQSMNRFGNQILVNEYSMRSKPLVNEADEFRILLLGDSVVNGGNLTTHSALATSLLEKNLQNNYGDSYRVLNASAGSWGPDNAAAYYKEFNNLKESAVVVIFSSHDAGDQMTKKPIVDIHPSYPGKQYPLAIFELIDRYIVPRALRLFKRNNTKLAVDEEKIEAALNPGWESILKLTQQMDTPLHIYLHADIHELSAGEYNEQGQKIIEFARKNKIPITFDLGNGLSEIHYRDSIHYNDEGQKLMAALLQPVLRGIIKDAVDNKTLPHD
ncbi:hypothetical protein ACFO4O_11790 [Glaciecola siphonariae]|uniref:SGNH hydrolase-type esterase domain-containing protein n=1 Tax=Glaciecola siphonariae TaxID=521012 RepID=A0ABV9LYF7_9ALTE